MSTTPEAKIKKLVKDALAEYAPLYQYWPVPAGFGPSSLDCIVCYRGYFFGIETKAPGKKPTARQYLCIQQMQAAGAITFVIDDQAGVNVLRKYLDLCRQSSQQNIS
jgi:hypothetical protein